ncbi:hypothetical protein SpAn4DRAFT_4624 [Sporomusa ovata]|uniref:Uncharacterized protein n=1 Tax=Sporomusa ovata TaxID=2378 RepID=A0A0U1KRS5_9FIRM|nr:hypothetical protein SpAn4DRAFT_4624 [Sporomusa ovata]
MPLGFTKLTKDKFTFYRSLMSCVCFSLFHFDASFKLNTV